VLKRITVEVDSKALRSFRRRAIAYAKLNKEYYEALAIVKRKDKYKIVEFKKIKLTKATAHVVEACEDELDVYKKDLKLRRKRYGSIHTHVNCESSPSLGDMHDGTHNKDYIFGICQVSKHKSGRYKTTIHFWQVQPPSEIIQVSK
jgi:hypothetical protein